MSSGVGTLDRPGMVVMLDVNDLPREAAFWSAALGFAVRRPVEQFMVLRPDDPTTRTTRGRT